MDLAGVAAVTIPEGAVARIFDSTENVVWGTHKSKTYTFTVQVENNLGTASKTFEMTIV